MWSVHALGSSRLGPLRCCVYAVFLSGSDDSICEEAWFGPRRVVVDMCLERAQRHRGFRCACWHAAAATGAKHHSMYSSAMLLAAGAPLAPLRTLRAAAGPASSHSIAGGSLSWGLGAMCAQRQGHAAPSPPHSITPPRCFSDASEIARCSAMRGPHRRRGHAWQLGSPAGPRGVRFAAPACCDTRSTGRAPCRGLDGAGTGACRGGGGRAVAVPCAQGQEGLPLVLHDLHAIGSRRAVAWGV